MLRSLLLVPLLILASGAEPDAPAASRTVTLASPLTTVIPAEVVPDGGVGGIAVRLTVGSDAPDDLGIGAFFSDDDGRWHQILHDGRLAPGDHALRFDLDAVTPIAERHRSAWNPYQAERVAEAGVFLWSAQASRATIEVEALTVTAADADPGANAGRLHDVRVDGAEWRDGVWHCGTGERLTLTVRPDPFPAMPFTTDAFALAARLEAPDGRVIRRRGFYHEPVRLIDRGSHETARAAGPAAFSVRFRPRTPGRYRLVAEPRWGDGAPRRVTLGTVEVTGAAWNGYVRVDPEDPRFFSTGDGDFVWPIGLNARSVNDPRGAERTGSRLTPDRGWHAYRAYLDRWAAGGVTAVEVWMSSWNLALEWRGDWPGYGGVGRYHQGNAARLDRLLDAAWKRRIRVNLVIRNHGQGSHNVDAEWENNPYNQRHPGGTLEHPRELFTDDDALAGQERLRRYLTARYADHPAILGWKLWTEVNLTNSRDPDRRTWHEQAAARWAELDPYDHPVTTHWSGDYRTPDRQIVAQDGIDYVCIDAYHRRQNGKRGTILADLLVDGLHHDFRGLAQFDKPVLVTEYGGNWNAAPQPQLLSEHQHGPWAALVSGYAGAPMLWWLEWIDQSGRYAPYHAVGRFLDGEDLRSRTGSAARSEELTAEAAERDLWCRTWTRPGRLLGYLLDPDWAYDGSASISIDDAAITVGDQIMGGPMVVEWWDCDTGRQHQRDAFQHPGGALVLRPPSFARHCAFKLYRATADENAGTRLPSANPR